MQKFDGEEETVEIIFARGDKVKVTREYASKYI
jgi:hypothetical protein